MAAHFPPVGFPWGFRFVGSERHRASDPFPERGYGAGQWTASGEKYFIAGQNSSAQNLDAIDQTAYSNIRIVTNSQMQAAECDLYALLGQADALITDYSSVYFDYLLLNRPIGFTVDDIQEYMANRGFVVEDPYPLMPGRFLNTPEEFREFLKDTLEGSDPFAEKTTGSRKTGQPIQRRAG